MAGKRRLLGTIMFPVIVTALIATGAIIYGAILHRLDFGTAYTDFIRVLTFVDWFIFGLIVIIEIVSLFIDRDATVITAVFSFCILLAFSCSSDAVRIYFGGTMPDLWISRIYASLSFFFVAGALATVLLFVAWEFGIQISRPEYIIAFAGLGFVAIAYWPMSAIGMEIIPLIGMLFFIIYVSIKVIIHTRFIQNLTYSTVAVFLIASLLISAVCSYAISAFTGYAFSAYGWFSITTAIVSLLFLSVYVHFVYQTTRKAYKNEQNEKTVKALQSSVLKEQIAPHFLFNSLQAVKTNYHISKDKGDIALDLLSRHLRNYVESGEKFLVPFAKELDSVMTFVELANIRTEKPFNIIYDIDAEDFEVPTLSIETFIENAILYSGVNEKEDGHIEISSFEKDGAIVVRISDNGRGFDQANVREGAVGIKNAFERFRLLLNAECSIQSALGVGTTITVVIPKEVQQ